MCRLDAERGGQRRADTIAYYRFETGPSGAVATSIIDSSGNNRTSSILSGGPIYSADIPVSQISQTGQSNALTLSFGGNDVAAFGYPFPFDTPNDAMLELWLKVPTDTEWDFLWTTTAGGDANRYNIHTASGNQACIDYREPGGGLHLLGCSGPNTVPFGQWSYVAYVKQGSVYSIYVNGPGTGNVTTLTSQVTDSVPNLPTSSGWTINGRDFVNGVCCSGSGLVDEIRLSNTALSPSQFLVSPPPTVAFSAFSGKLEISQTSFQLKGSFTLGSGSNGIKPLTEAVTLTVGNYTVTIPGRSFKGSGAGPFTFQGVINGVNLQVRINLTNSQTRQYSLQAEASGASLAGTPDPAPVTLTIGDDSGTTSIRY